MARAGQTDKVKYGSTVRISGAVAQGSAGVPVHLERSLGGTQFAQVAQTTTQNGGSYGFKVKARRSAAYRAVAQNGTAASQSRKVTVLAKIAGRSQRNVLGTHPVRVKGTMLPRLRGRAIKLQQKTRRGWKTVDATRTGRGGRFKATFRPRSHGSYRLRVKFPGDANAAAARDYLRIVRVYKPGGASWYSGGSGACGSLAGMTVAHKTLPCGTKVTLRYRGRSVVARVMDRGPFIAGREWDLTPQVKNALGFGDVGTIWANK
jgi:hypothetical protein